MKGRAYGEGETVIVRGRDHPLHGAVTVETLSSAVAIATSAGARPKSHPPLDANEDCAAVVRGPRAVLLVVADAHRGCDAAELAVSHVVGVLGGDLRPGDLADDEIVTILWDAGMSVQRGTSRAGGDRLTSRTTLALALAAGSLVQWGSFGDSAVLVASAAGATRLDAPRSAYLGYSFSRAEIGALATAGSFVRRPEDVVILATDGLMDYGVRADGSLEQTVSAQLGGTPDAATIARRLVEVALQRDAADAITVAIAAGW